MRIQIAWPLIANFSCPQGATTCTRAENMGWRYLLFTLGGMTLLLWAIRFFVFPLEESPRFLVGRGRDEEAVAVIQRIANFNGRECRLTVDQLRAAGEAAAAPRARAAAVLANWGGGLNRPTPTTQSRQARKRST